MGPKLLFIFGIVLAHGALAAGWVAQEAPRHRTALISSCTQQPTAPLHIAPRRELLAFAVTVASEEVGVLHQ
jgi:predicted MFS family arabinose efflux permease